MRETKDTQQDVESFYRQHGLVDVDMDTPEWQRVRERLKRISKAKHHGKQTRTPERQAHRK